MSRCITALLALGLVAGAAVPATAGTPPSLPPFDQSVFDATMTLERVEPHVVRVIDDGAGHDLTDLNTFEDLKPVSLLAAGDDGSVWMTSSGGFTRIGTRGEVPDPLDTFLAQMEIGPDGTLWIADGYRGSSIGEWRDGAWTIHELPSTAWVVWMDATPDGRLDFAWRDETTLTFERLPGSDGDGVLLPSPLRLGSPDGSVAVERTADGRTWVAEGRSWLEGSRYTRFEPGPLWSFDGTAWHAVEPLGGLPVQPRDLAVDERDRLRVSWWEVAPDGARLGPSYLTRRGDGGDWSIFHDGGWIDLSGADDVLTGDSGRDWCTGYTRFDGQEPTHYLEGLCLRPAAITPSGDIWVFGHKRNRQDPGVYVISPER